MKSSAKPFGLSPCQCLPQLQNPQFSYQCFISFPSDHRKRPQPPFHFIHPLPDHAVPSHLHLPPSPIDPESSPLDFIASESTHVSSARSLTYLNHRSEPWSSHQRPEHSPNHRRIFHFESPSSSLSCSRFEPPSSRASSPKPLLSPQDQYQPILIVHVSSVVVLLILSSTLSKLSSLILCSMNADEEGSLLNSQSRRI